MNIKVLIKDFIGQILYISSKVVPKDDRIWIFGAWQGKAYADNSKYLFEYINREHKNIRAIWVSKDKNIVNDINSLGYEAYKFYSIKSIILSMRAKVFFETEGSQDILKYCSGGSKIIQLCMEWE